MIYWKNHPTLPSINSQPYFKIVFSRVHFTDFTEEERGMGWDAIGWDGNYLNVFSAPEVYSNQLFLELDWTKFFFFEKRTISVLTDYILKKMFRFFFPVFSLFLSNERRF